MWIATKRFRGLHISFGGTQQIVWYVDWCIRPRIRANNKLNDTMVIKEFLNLKHWVSRSITLKLHEGEPTKKPDDNHTTVSFTNNTSLFTFIIVCIVQKYLIHYNNVPNISYKTITSFINFFINIKYFLKLTYRTWFFR